MTTWEFYLALVILLGAPLAWAVLMLRQIAKEVGPWL